MKKGKQVCKKEFLAGLVVERQYKENKAIKFNYFFTNRRINSKYLQLANKYKDIKLLDYNYIYSELIEIIVEILDSMKKDYIFIADNNRSDDISYIITTMEQRINDKIDKNWTFSYRDRSKENLERDEDQKDKGDTELEYSLDDILKNDNGEEVTRGSITPEEDSIFYNHNTKSDEEIDTALDKIYKDAKLTKRQIEILEALERTEDNYNNKVIYTRARAAEILGTSEGNVRKTLNEDIKHKIINAYNNEVPGLTSARENLINKLEDFLDGIESEKDVIEFIKNNLEEEFVLYILYDSKLDAGLRRYFNQNKDKEEELHSDTMRKFTTYFIKEVYEYIGILKHNESMSKAIPLPRKEKESQGEVKPVNGAVTKYIRENKATRQQKLNDYILIDNEKYYLVKDDETVEIPM